MIDVGGYLQFVAINKVLESKVRLLLSMNMSIFSVKVLPYDSTVPGDHRYSSSYREMALLANSIMVGCPWSTGYSGTFIQRYL